MPSVLATWTVGTSARGPWGEHGLNVDIGIARATERDMDDVDSSCRIPIALAGAGCFLPGLFRARQTMGRSTRTRTLIRISAAPRPRVTARPAAGRACRDSTRNTQRHRQETAQLSMKSLLTWGAVPTQPGADGTAQRGPAHDPAFHGHPSRHRSSDSGAARRSAAGTSRAGQAARRAFFLTFSITRRDAVYRRGPMPAVDSVRRGWSGGRRQASGPAAAG